MADSLLSLPEPPTAIFAASDVQAIGILQAASRRGVGCRKSSRWSASTTSTWPRIVGLTTIRQPLFDGGARAADLLIGAIERGEHEPLEERQSLTVMERRTT